jgi:antirestriction protein ArdC
MSAKGERGTTVCYADRFIPKEERTRASEEGDEPNAIPIMKRFTVFQVSCSNVHTLLR